ncbi:DUF5681 domain-containing protein [Metallibacterium sp.]|jgi:hypothetical protein|uniref:DUF5681 domain-containing protein n=1 Tax=Metallibacterium sp. TaxID=2940281 RepID=UPI0026353D5B|nr:DUF5681 domain-containing protein [Metallibacterium sp.]
MTTKRNPPAQRWKPGQSGNPKGKPPGTLGIASKLRQQIDVKAIIAKLSESAAKGNTRAAELLLDRALPPLRSVAEPVELPGLKDAATLTAKAERIVELAAEGKVSPDIATALLSAIGTLAKATEIDELKRRIEALEAPRVPTE